MPVLDSSIEQVMAALDNSPDPRAYLAQWVRVAVNASVAMEMIKQLAKQGPTIESRLVLACVAAYEDECDGRAPKGEA